MNVSTDTRVRIKTDDSFNGHTGYVDWKYNEYYHVSFDDDLKRILTGCYFKGDELEYQ